MINRKVGAAATVMFAFAAATLTVHWDPAHPAFYVGLSTGITAVVVFTLGAVLDTGRKMNEHFEAGYRQGFRQGRRAPMHSVQAVNSGDPYGRIQEATVRSLASHRANARRAAEDAHGPLEGGREGLGGGR